MVFKLLVIAILLAILISLGSGLLFLVQHKEKSPRIAKALTLRISLSLILFLLLMIGYALGLITPHGIYPTAP